MCVCACTACVGVCACVYMCFYVCTVWHVFVFRGGWQFSHFMWSSRIHKKIAHKKIAHKNINCLGVRSTWVIVVLQHVGAALSFKLFYEDSYQIWRVHYFPWSSQLLSVLSRLHNLRNVGRSEVHTNKRSNRHSIHLWYYYIRDMKRAKLAIYSHASAWSA